MTLVVTPRNKQQEKVLKAFLTSLDITFHSEEEENEALFKAMEKGRKSALLNADEKEALLKKLKSAR